MPFLPPNQQRQSTEGITILLNGSWNSLIASCFVIWLFYKSLFCRIFKLFSPPVYRIIHHSYYELAKSVMGCVSAQPYRRAL